MIVKFVSLNMWHGGVLLDEILQFLNEQNADVVLLQEVYNGSDPSLPQQYRSLQVLNECLGYGFHDFVADYLDLDRTNGKAQRGNAILSRLPIVKKEAIFFDNP